ncbi:ubiquitin C-terminal hydrolase L3 [Magnaporthiopsis poae ATCC 64411]|uniref:Ubiquitin carboxyl-terminal hydrolase n=1 Tax=Magnaporthiopsis poae (strain ATCC 64411 / 73-15) TaxID=644358 RepID=A0A0C4DLE6_MAGP6|nr:ubiquitin C-terminal hydrolase L3 [Magnaporthiopsis poae ATCC 64411]
MAYIPLESNPDVFTGLAHRLGLSPQLAFHDVLSLDEPELLALVPRPVRALVLAFPAPEDNYERRMRDQENDGRPVYDRAGDDEDVVWFRQTIYNACGLYALLHALANGACDHIGSADAKVDHHYICFAKSPKDGHIYELDGDLKGPVSWADLGTEDDLLGEAALAVVREFIRKGPGDGGSFSLLALAPST